MVVTVAKWGDSLAVRLPQHLAKKVQLHEGTEVELVVVDGSLVIKPRARKCYALETLVTAITPENQHPELDSNRPIGTEAW